MLLYYITDRRQWAGDEPARRRLLLARIEEAARAGVDYIQLREKDLPARALERLAHEAAEIIRSVAPVRGTPDNSKLETRNSKLLLSSRLDVALAVGADGVHLPAGDLSPSDVRAIVAAASRNSRLETRSFLVACSCHSLDELRSARDAGADFAVFGPVFEKVGEHARPGLGLDALRAACHGQAAKPARALPVLALGGVTLANARACLEAGAAGIAAIRLFQENDIADAVHALRALR